ncbi:MAG: hypothetical protein FJ279_29605, partial [Planctomycetes bacterium]|nr:hypothetical protein [Planctomycetota bacterium]
MVHWVFAASTGAAEHGAEKAAGSSVPEVSNLITLIHHAIQETRLGHFLHNHPDWENIVFSWCALLILCLVVYFALRSRKLIPSGLQNLVEMAMEALDNLVCSV